MNGVRNLLFSEISRPPPFACPAAREQRGEGGVLEMTQELVTLPTRLPAYQPTRLITCTPPLIPTDGRARC